MILDTAVSNVPLRIGIGVILCLVLVGTGVGMGAAQATTTNVTVNGEPLANSGERVVLEDPTANVSVESADPINLIEIRVNGEIRNSYRPDTRSFEQAVPLSLDPNENTVEVIARGDSVSTFKTTLTKNTAAPRVRYTSPFSTTVLGGPENETNVSSGQVTLAGDLHTVSEVDRIQIERTHVVETEDEGNQTDRKLYRITDPGDSFLQDLLLGNGKNEIVARYTDTNGRTNTDSFDLMVDDATDPNISLKAPDKSYTDSVRIRGEISDETKLDRVAINRTSNNASQVLLTSSGPEPDRERLSYTLDTEVNLFNDNDDNEFRLVAEDATGNVQERIFTVEYDPTPQVILTENTTNTTTETVHVVGNVSKAQVSRVTIETIDTRSGKRLDITRVYDAGLTTAAVEFDQQLTAVPEETVVNILVTYENGQYTRSVSPVISTPQETTADDEVAEDSDESTVDNSSDTNTPESGNGTSGVVSAVEPGSDSGEPTDDDEGGLPTLIPIRTREAFGGVVIVGTIYLFEHWT
ncbi:hypothetical protein [Halorubrum sp. AJ67]|uniref:hypothetical protein n=1 Tax=Halorubrum sp. AJ67 TaxID=1173487 RepID=UPI0003DC5766|nr:hypothetical protein [Halorubrum sp. AJ67]CDK40334.1 putative signal peptide protein [Halorubrum sp. AJ67]